MMEAVNLMPRRRVLERARQRHLLHWFVGGGIYGVLIAALWISVHLMSAQRYSALDGKLQAVNAAIDRSTTQLQAIAPKLVEINASVAADRRIARKPDWSLLLDMLAKLLGRHVVLSGCDLRPVMGIRSAGVGPAMPLPAAGAAKGAGDAPVDGGYTLELTGIGDAQTEVSQYVLRLEQSGIFKRVKLIDTHKQMLLGHSGIGFKIVCQL